MYVTRVPNRGSRPTILLRESYREGGRVRNRTLANLTRWPEERVRALERALKGEPAGVDPGALEVVRSLPHGHVAAVLGTLRRLGLEEVIDPAPSRPRSLAVAMVVARVAEPSSKLATARGLAPETASSTLGEVLGVSSADEDDLYSAMDFLLTRQGRIEEALARRHLAGGTLVLYDVSSAAFEGRTCPLARLGYARDGVKGRLQVVYGLLTTAEGCPVAVEVFEGDTADPTTLARQVEKLKGRFGLRHLVFVGDRGMLTKARIEEDLRGAGLDWVTALRAPAIKALVEGGRSNPPCWTRPTWGRSSPPPTPASAWWSAATRSSPPSARGSGRSCSGPPRPSWGRSGRPRRGSGDPCGGPTGSGCGWGGSSTATRWPSTSGSRSGRRACPSAGTRGGSLKRRRSTGSTSCAPACPPTASPPPRWSSRTSGWPGSSGPSEPTTPTSISAPSTTAGPTGSGPTC